MDSAFWGWVGGIGGSLIGLAGGVFGTWCGIRNTASPAERANVTRWAAGFWIFVTAFLVGLFLLPQPYNVLLWIPYGFGLVYLIRRCNEGQARLRAGG